MDCAARALSEFFDALQYQKAHWYRVFPPDKNEADYSKLDETFPSLSSHGGLSHETAVFCDAGYRVYSGVFESGLEHGAGEEWFSDGSVFREEFKEEKRNSAGSFVKKWRV
jgi:hypothetical protein